jgi:hypothetical protein
MSSPINLKAKPAEFIQYEHGSSVLVIDNPDGGLPIEVECDSRKKVDIDAALAELSLITGKPVDYWYVTFDE